MAKLSKIPQVVQESARIRTTATNQTMSVQRSPTSCGTIDTGAYKFKPFLRIMRVADTCGQQPRDAWHARARGR